MDLVRPLALTAPYAWFFWGLLAWAYTLESLQMKKRQQRSAEHGGADRYSGLVISVGNAVLQVLAFALAFYAPWQLQGSHGAVLFFSGFAVVAAGMLLRLHCWKMLGIFFTHTVTIANDHRVIDHGAYRWLRHPSYLGALMTFAGLGLMLQNQGSLWLLTLGSWLVYAYRIKVEEDALEGSLGESYRRFKQTRKRLIPFVY